MEPSVPQLDVQEGASANLLPPSKLDVALHMHCLYLGAAGGGSPPSPGVMQYVCDPHNFSRNMEGCGKWAQPSLLRVLHNGVGNHY